MFYYISNRANITKSDSIGRKEGGFAQNRCCVASNHLATAMLESGIPLVLHGFVGGKEHCVEKIMSKVKLDEQI